MEIPSNFFTAPARHGTVTILVPRHGKAFAVKKIDLRHGKARAGDDEIRLDYELVNHFFACIYFILLNLNYTAGILGRARINLGNSTPSTSRATSLNGDSL
ncbi:unnamed protein product [Oikopleura dioica]|uniref:Uncharacterized protein n=1 Tax=Oikopleura dioica TaxID=34765 RepID=E4XWR8_OIKDI|nr:unnamed protein product [Oikopleura dioica]